MTAAFVAFLVPGPPVGKGRPRAAPGGRVHSPKGTIEAESRVHVYGRQAMGETAPWPAGTPVALTIEAVFPIAVSWSKRKREAARAGSIRPTRTPDPDNIVKLVSDALEGVLWVNDNQIVDVAVRKTFGDVPGMWISARAITE